MAFPFEQFLAPFHVGITAILDLEPRRVRYVRREAVLRARSEYLAQPRINQGAAFGFSPEMERSLFGLR
jgi:hypothetical protein